MAAELGGLVQEQDAVVCECSGMFPLGGTLLGGHHYSIAPAGFNAASAARNACRPAGGPHYTVAWSKAS